jgi:amidase
VHWHIEEARKLGGPYIARLAERQYALFARMQRFMERFEFFVLPVSQVLPFDVTRAHPTEIAGVAMESYIAWMKSAWYISTVGNPALSVPAAFSRTGLPIGVQIVGRHHADLAVLQLGHAYEQATRIGERRPLLAG